MRLAVSILGCILKLWTGIRTLQSNVAIAPTFVPSHPCSPAFKAPSPLLRAEAAPLRLVAVTRSWTKKVLLATIEVVSRRRRPQRYPHRDTPSGLGSAWETPSDPIVDRSTKAQAVKLQGAIGLLPRAASTVGFRYIPSIVQEGAFFEAALDQLTDHQEGESRLHMKTTMPSRIDATSAHGPLLRLQGRDLADLHAQCLRKARGAGRTTWYGA